MQISRYTNYFIIILLIFLLCFTTVSARDINTSDFVNLSWSPNGTYLAAVESENAEYVMFYELGSPDDRNDPNPFASNGKAISARDVLWPDNNSQIIFLLDNGTIIRSSYDTTRTDVGAYMEIERKYNTNITDLMTIKMLHNEEILASLDTHQNLYLFNITDASNNELTLITKNQNIDDYGWYNGKLVMVNNNENTFELYNITTGQSVTRSLPSSAKNLTTNTRQTVISFQQNEKIIKWDETNELFIDVISGNDTMRVHSWDPSGNILAYSFDDRIHYKNLTSGYTDEFSPDETDIRLISVNIFGMVAANTEKKTTAFWLPSSGFVSTFNFKDEKSNFPLPGILLFQSMVVLTVVVLANKKKKF